jgi:hypothetical protein
VSIGGTGATPALYGTIATGDLNIVGIRCSVAAGASPAPPTNGSILAWLGVVTGSVGGGATVTPSPTGQSSLAAVSTWKSGSTALTGLTQSTLKWSGDIAFAAGAIWGEWFPTSFERSVPNGGLIAVYFTAASGAGSNMLFHVSLEIAE